MEKNEIIDGNLWQSVTLDDNRWMMTVMTNSMMLTMTPMSQVMGKNKSEVHYSSPAEEYFQREVLEVHKSQGIAEWVRGS